MRVVWDNTKWFSRQNYIRKNEYDKPTIKKDIRKKDQTQERYFWDWEREKREKTTRFPMHSAPPLVKSRQSWINCAAKSKMDPERPHRSSVGNKIGSNTAIWGIQSNLIEVYFENDRWAVYANEREGRFVFLFVAKSARTKRRGRRFLGISR